MKREIVMHQRPSGLIVPGLPPPELEGKKKPKPKPQPKPRPGYRIVPATERDMLEVRRVLEK